MSNRLTRRERRAAARQAKKLMPAVEAQKPSFWYWLAPCLAAFVVYLPSLGFDFIRNDRTQISAISSFWVEVSQPNHNFSKYYRPASSAWMWFVNYFAGFNPGVWHLSSLILHILATYLVYCLAKKLLENESAAMCAAFVFAVHAVHNDAILWILASNELLYVIGFLAALLLFEEHRWWALAAWSFALASKETAIVLLPVLLALTRKLPGTWTKRLRNLAPYLGVSILYLAIRALVVPSGALGGKLSGLPWRATFYTAPFVLGDYLRKLIWPGGLSPMYGLQLHFASSPLMWLAAVLIVSALTALALATKKHVVFGFSAALIALPLIPALYAMRFSPDIEMVQDRYLYLPSVGFCLLLGWIAKHTLETWRTRSIVGLTAITTVFALLCYAQEGFYANQEAMYARTAEFAPDNQYVSLQLASSYAAEGRYEEALAQYNHACSLGVNLDCIAGLATGQYFTHRYAEALPNLRTVVRVMDHTDSGHNPTTLIQHEQFLLWLADTQRQLGDSSSADETTKRAQVIASEISAKPEANALARAFKIPTLPGQVSR